MAKPSYTLKALNVPVFLGLLATHALLFNAFVFCFSWWQLLFCLISIIPTVWVGVSLCYHRLLTHEGFETPNWVKYTLVVMGVFSNQAGPIWWVGKHRLHHAHSDDSDGGDPHTTDDGFGWAHMWWLVFRKTNGKNLALPVRDLMNDPGIVFIDRWSWVLQTVFILLCVSLGYYFGGWKGSDSLVSWQVGARVALCYHVTWLVNSICHTEKYGYQNFPTPGKDHSRNVPWVAWLTGGEGNHANHHGDPRSVSHGMLPGEVDMVYWMVKGLERLGLATNLQLPKVWKNKKS